MIEVNVASFKLPHAYAGAQEKRRDVWGAFTVWMLVNAIAGGFLLALSAFSTPPGEGSQPRIDVTIPAVALAALNIAVAVAAWYARRYLAIGMVVALATVLAVGVVGGTTVNLAALFAASMMVRGADMVAPFFILLIGFVVVVVGLLFGLRAVQRRIR